jgi:hypothetical protein
VSKLSGGNWEVCAQLEKQWALCWKFPQCNLEFASGCIGYKPISDHRDFDPILIIYFLVFELIRMGFIVCDKGLQLEGFFFLSIKLYYIDKGRQAMGQSSHNSSSMMQLMPTKDKKTSAQHSLLCSYFSK